MPTTTSYVPYDYRRVCDLCGNLYQRSKMFKKGQYTYCADHAGERTTEELDRANARARPFRILPVPNAKPDDPLAPDVFEAEESDVVALLDAVLPQGARYAQVVEGSATAIPNSYDVIQANSWACAHYYRLLTATYPRGHKNLWPDQIAPRMRLAADRLLALQSVTGTRATNAFFGAFLGTSATIYYPEDTAVAGLAMLYAYRTLGDAKYLVGARSAASFLRNAQALGSNGVNFTSSDYDGTVRLYTGAIVNAIYSDFTSDQRMYPGGLLALQMWNELKLTDGDQTIGATAAIASMFTTAPSALMSTCMSDLRTFWLTGTYDATKLTVVNGFSSTTPAEYFAAYPVGSGSWEYWDYGPTTGTTITSLNFAKGIAALYAVDGVSAKVAELDTWLQTFTSNSAYETPSSTSPAGLRHLTTGVYAATTAPAQVLLVRDSTSNYAAIAKNGNSLYDWGAFGLMSPLWARRHAAAFKPARNQACRARQRFADGKPSDGNWDDVGFLRGRQGLSWQTGFTEQLMHGPDNAVFGVSGDSSSPPANPLFWFKADAGVTKNASNQVSKWADQSGNGLDVTPVTSFGGLLATSQWPVYTTNVINGLPGLLYSHAAVTAMQHLYDAGTLNKPTADGAPFMALALVKMASLFGGYVVTLRLNDFDLEFGMRKTNLFLIGNCQIPVSSAQDSGAKIVQPVIDYTGLPLAMDWQWFGASSNPQAAARINTSQLRWASAYASNSSNYSGESGFSIGYCNANNEALDGYITEVIAYAGTDSATLAGARAYMNKRAGITTSTTIVYDGVAAAQFGQALMQEPRR